MSWDLVEMWHSMSFIPRAVVFTLVFTALGIAMSGIGLLVAGGGVRKYLSTGNSNDKTQRR